MHGEPGGLDKRPFHQALLWFGVLIVSVLLLFGAGFVETTAEEPGVHVYNVRDYGAKGDGVTDDSAAIQAAINAASGAGGTVTVPLGTYAVGSTINLESGVTLQGQGGVLAMGRQSEVTNLLSGVDVDRVTIRDLTLRAGTASDRVIAIHLTGHTNSVIERVVVVNGYYGLKADTSGANLTVRDFTVRAGGQPIYVSNLNGGLFERLDLDAVLTKLEATDFHGIYVGENNHDLAFRTVKLTGGSGFTLHLYSEAGWARPSDGISFDGLTVDGRWAVVIGSGFQDVTFRDVTAHASVVDDAVFTLYDPRDVTVDGFVCSGGAALLGARETTQAQRVLFQDGTYDGTTLSADPNHFDSNPIGSGVRLGTALPTTTITTVAPTSGP